jgi:hypothetical protein
LIYSIDPERGVRLAREWIEQSEADEVLLARDAPRYFPLVL